MILKEKNSVIVTKDDKKYYLYGPMADSLDIECFGEFRFFWLLSKPVTEAKIDDVIECVDPIKVWFSDFQIYKYILKKVYGYEVFNALSEKRWEFLNSNKNRFKLLFIYVGDYGCYQDEYTLFCFDTLKSEYISLCLNRPSENEFKINKIITNETDLSKIYEAIFNSELVEQNKFNNTKEGFTYSLDHKEYEPLFLLYKFVSAFYYYYVVDGDLVSKFSPLDAHNVFKIDGYKL